MSGYILCQVKRAKNPYYISNISTNIYSIEELCYYLYHNIYLLDETIINEQLLVWMKEELHLRRLYQRLYVLLEEKKNIGEFILPIFKEINYLSHDQFREMNERLKRFEEQPEIVRKKIKGDYLVDHEKYINDPGLPGNAERYRGKRNQHGKPVHRKYLQQHGLCLRKSVPDE